MNRIVNRLPEGWVSVPFVELLHEPLRNGHSARASETQEGVPTLTLSAVTNGDFSLKNVKRTVAQVDRVQDLWLEPGDILIERANTSELVGTSAMFPGPPGYAIFPDLMIRARTLSDVDPRYVTYFLRAPDTRRYFQEKAQGIAGSMPKIDQAAVEALSVAVAPTRERIQIVAEIERYLSRLDAATAALEAAQKKLKAYRASVLKAAVEGRLVPTEASLARAEKRDYEPADVLLKRILVERRRRWEEAELAKLKASGKPPKDDRWKAKYEEPKAPDTAGLPELPEGWCWASCHQIVVELQTGPFGSALHKSDYVVGGTPVINPQHLQDCSICPSGRVAVAPETVSRLSAFALKVGDIVLGRRGEMGRCAVVGPKEAGWLLGTGSLACRVAPGVGTSYFAWAIRSPYSVQWLQGASVGTTMTNLNQEIFLGLPVPMPPEPEQERIVEEIERQSTLNAHLDQAVAHQVARANRLRQAILKWAFEGKLVDQDPNDEPAEKLLARIRAERADAVQPKRTRRAKAAE